MSRREQLRDATKEEIKVIARQQMAERGTAGLSLALIAKSLGMTPPALYRYYASRDDLITTLIVEAFEALAEALQVVAEETRGQPDADRLLMMMLAYRRWAISHPVDFQLIYGNPIPAYAAPEELTVPAARQGFAVLIGVLQEADRREALRLQAGFTVASSLLGAEETLGTSPVLAYVGIVGWTRIHGIIMLELFNHLQPMVGDVAAFYQHEVITFLHSVGLFPTITP